MSRTRGSKSAAVARRRAVICELIEQHNSPDHDGIVALLEDHGIDVTQATVSRDLKAIGAILVRLPGGGVTYRLPRLTDRTIGVDSLTRTFVEHVRSATVVGNMIVLATTDGAASMVASNLDRSKVIEVVGTVAGRDTVFVLCSQDAERVAEGFRVYIDDNMEWS